MEVTTVRHTQSINEDRYILDNGAYLDDDFMGDAARDYYAEYTLVWDRKLPSMYLWQDRE